MSADTDMELKACPFCGSDEVGVHPDEHHIMLCDNCEAQGPRISFGEPRSAQERWNTRAALDASGIGGLVAENRELRNIIASLGYCAPEASLEFMRLIPGEVALSRARATVGNRREYNVMARSDIGPLEAWEEAISIAKRCDERAASADTHPKGGDVQQAPSPMSGAVANGETPNLDSATQSGEG